MEHANTKKITTAFNLQKDGVEQQRITFGLKERRAALARLSDIIQKNEAEVIKALAQDFAKPETETVLTEILLVQQEIKHARAHLRRWMRPKRVAPTLVGFGTSARVRPEARGVCLIIAPWNYPFTLAMGPLVSALAAGNSVILKPSEMTPATSKLIADLIGQVFPPELVTVIEGGVETSSELLKLPFDHIFFTGSPEVGKIVMTAASKTLASVTLELGGKSPTIIGKDANLEQAAKWVVFGKFSNAGQTCIAPDYLYVDASIEKPFIAALKARITKTYGQGYESLDMAQIVSSRHADRLAGLLKDAKSKGASIIQGGQRKGRKFAPTLLTEITPDMDIDREEVFGPILPIYAFSDMKDVITRINAHPKPLALYIFDKNRSRIDEVLNATSSGTVGVNLTNLHFSHLNMPFGGVNSSGIGAAHGFAGFRAFSHERAILTNSFSLIPLIFPPYTKGVKNLVQIARRVLG